jgi:hypothetical protein
MSSSFPQVRFYANALPDPLYRAIRKAVEETGHERLEPEYTLRSVEGVSRITFWYELGTEPRNVVEQGIARLHSVVRPGRECVGTEYWLGRTQAGVPVPFHYHNSADRSPTRVAVLYLNDVDEELVVTNMMVDEQLRKNRVKATRYICLKPAANTLSVMLGGQTHGVLPRPGWEKPEEGPWNDYVASPASKLRLTVPIDWWRRRPAPKDMTCLDYDGSLFPALKRKWEGDPGASKPRRIPATRGGKFPITPPPR